MRTLSPTETASPVRANVRGVPTPRAWLRSRPDDMRCRTAAGHVRVLARRPLTLWAAAALAVAALTVSTAGLTGCGSGAGRGAGVAEAPKIWYCPMHPTQTSDKPGDCPICQMRLVPLARKTTGVPKQPAGGATPGPGDSASASAAEAGDPLGRRTMYRSTMNPAEVSDHPGKDSMGMDMVPFDARSSAGSPAGWGVVETTPALLQKNGVTFGAVEVRSVSWTIRTAGRVAIDETRVHHIHTKFSGWIEDVAADYIGRSVKQDDLLFTVYSPELVATQEEYLQARRTLKEMTRAGADAEIVRGTRELADAALRRLDLMDVSQAEIAAIEYAGRARHALPIYSPISGIVIQKTAQHGMYVSPETEEFAIADLSSVWILADVYESEIPLVRLGQKAEVSLSYFPGRVHRGQVAYLYPTLDPATRTAKVRIELRNPGGDLKPDMIADVALRIDAGRRTVIPKSAVLMTGDRAIAFIDLGGGRLAPREIRIGLRFDDDLEVLSGVSPGERVVTSANFLIDSESRLRSALAGAAGGAGTGALGAGADAAPPAGGERRP